jgi:Rrf2 family nitric oxide-sensitive transcriptional repressor
MRLTSYTNYTLRVLMVAAARSPLLTTIQEVADGFGISKAHLVKCVHQLGSWGYLETVRGNGGGFRLARPAGEIGIGEVVRRTEEGFTIVECFDRETNTCPLIDGCRFGSALQRATAAFLAVLDELTLADVTENGGELLGLLDLRPAGPGERGGRRRSAD